jgi:hypothetical protein
MLAETKYPYAASDHRYGSVVFRQVRWRERGAGGSPCVSRRNRDWPSRIGADLGERRRDGYAADVLQVD